MIDTRRRMNLYGALWENTEFDLCVFDHQGPCASGSVCLFEKDQGDVCDCGHVRMSHSTANSPPEQGAWCRCGCKRFGQLAGLFAVTNEGTAT